MPPEPNDAFPSHPRITLVESIPSHDPPMIFTYT